MKTETKKVTIGAETHRDLKQEAQKAGYKLSALADRIIREYLARQ